MPSTMLWARATRSLPADPGGEYLAKRLNEVNVLPGGYGSLPGAGSLESASVLEQGYAWQKVVLQEVGVNVYGKLKELR